MSDQDLIEWIEKEVKLNGVFEITQDEEFVDVDNTGTFRQERTMYMNGFTVSSQHVEKCGGFRNLVMEMIRASNEVKDEK